MRKLAELADDSTPVGSGLLFGVAAIVSAATGLIGAVGGVIVSLRRGPKTPRERDRADEE